ncbi:RNA polymerase sigma factor [Nocardioides sp.]|uniref:RNA polymerase sigma factor n=1 Tax=Nocardioides sp. TaxID=35761 RepID=UPI0027373819|nr:sigma-70 family RNA polymerase sigma factor [Nocardioides sp.]MDP3890283.1 sigma-70 family RNA polymerase sigma factor [Nocardioides sp.]
MTTSGTGERALERILREEAPQVLGALVRRFGRFELSEEAVQEALVVAHRDWSRDGLPREPRSWLIRVAYRKLIDLLRSEEASHRRERDALVTDPRLDPTRAPAPSPDHDDSLELLVLCCHPTLSAPSQIALTLRAVGGLTTAEIAHAYGVSESTMATRISRAKQTLRSNDVRFELTDDDDLDARASVVAKVLYLIFNEGYAATAGQALTRVDLTAEAIRLTRLLAQVLPQNAEIRGLLALMLLSEARRPARQDGDSLIPLADQDRNVWDRDLIDEGSRIVQDAWHSGPIGPFLIQAAINALHAQAPSAGDTDWPQIAALYLGLERVEPTNPVRLGRVVAVSRAFGARRGLALLDDLDRTHTLSDDPLTAGRTHAVRGHLLDEVGEHDAARTEFAAAQSLTTNEVERRYLADRAEHAGWQA